MSQPPEPALPSAVEIRLLEVRTCVQALGDADVHYSVEVVDSRTQQTRRLEGKEAVSLPPGNYRAVLYANGALVSAFRLPLDDAELLSHAQVWVNAGGGRGHEVRLGLGPPVADAGTWPDAAPRPAPAECAAVLDEPVLSLRVAVEGVAVQPDAGDL
jgi:hypothetical protein